MPKLTRDEILKLITQAEETFPHARDVCSTCECFLTYLAQLRMDSDSVDKELFLPFKVRREDMHHCLSCDPCPPGDLYAEYMKKKQVAVID